MKQWLANNVCSAQGKKKYPLNSWTGVKFHEIRAIFEKEWNFYHRHLELKDKVIPDMYNAPKGLVDEEEEGTGKERASKKTALKSKGLRCFPSRKKKISNNHTISNTVKLQSYLVKVKLVFESSLDFISQSPFLMLLKYLL